MLSMNMASNGISLSIVPWSIPGMVAVASLPVVGVVSVAGIAGEIPVQATIPTASRIIVRIRKGVRIS
jgi:hypothetical protein